MSVVKAPDNLSVQVAQGIFERIVSGALPPGSSLPSEREVQEQYGVSRTVVREALKLLAARGLVKTQNGQNAVVNDNLNAPAVDALLLAFYQAQVRVEDLLATRLVLEPEIVALAAEHGAALQRRRILELAKLMASVDPTHSEADKQAAQRLWDENDERFHVLLAEATQNPVLETLIKTLIGIVWRQREYANPQYSAEVIAQAAQQHLAIAQAVADRDPERARAAMITHLQSTRADLAGMQDSLRGLAMTLY